MRLELWDTAGQERYRSLAPMYYRGAAAALIVFDVTSAESFEGAQSWARELRRRGDPAMVVALVGNKVDIGHRVVELETAKTYATDNEFLYFETSAKTGYNVGELFIAIGEFMGKRQGVEEKGERDETPHPPLTHAAPAPTLNPLHCSQAPAPQLAATGR